jgi:peptidoglycan/LPS O-acetylase OafA/YrhL
MSLFQFIRVEGGVKFIFKGGANYGLGTSVILVQQAKKLCVFYGTTSYSVLLTHRPIQSWKNATCRLNTGNNSYPLFMKGICVFFV